MHRHHTFWCRHWGPAWRLDQCRNATLPTHPSCFLQNENNNYTDYDCICGCTSAMLAFAGRHSG